MMPVSKSFFARDSKEVGYDLIGKLLLRNFKGQTLTGLISQVDAYSMKNPEENKRT